MKLRSYWCSRYGSESPDARVQRCLSWYSEMSMKEINKNRILRTGCNQEKTFISRSLSPVEKSLKNILNHLNSWSQFEIRKLVSPKVLILRPNIFELGRMSWAFGRTMCIECSRILCSKRVGAASGFNRDSIKSVNNAVSVNHSKKSRALEFEWLCINVDR